MIVGVTVVLAVFVDALMTTLAVSAGAGPLTSRVLSAGWRFQVRYHRAGRPSIGMRAGGTFMLVLTVLMWVALLWSGWLLVFLASDSLVNAVTREPVGGVDVVYFVGMSLFTLGTGDVVATEGHWRLVSALTAFTGLFIITLALTYLVSVIAAVVARRALAMHIRALGADAQEIVRAGWGRHGFTPMFQQQLVSLTPMVTTSAEHHLAYPVLHYFHSADPAVAAPLQLAHLDDALVLMSEVIAEGQRPDPGAVRPLACALKRYVATVTGIAWVPDVSLPPAPDPRPLAEARLPVGRGSSRHTKATTTRHRALLHALVVRDGWRWHN